MADSGRSAQTSKQYPVVTELSGSCVKNGNRIYYEGVWLFRIDEEAGTLNVFDRRNRRELAFTPDRLRGMIEEAEARMRRSK